jgi:hypothetical protein
VVVCWADISNIVRTEAHTMHNNTVTFALEMWMACLHALCTCTHVGAGGSPDVIELPVQDPHRECIWLYTQPAPGAESGGVAQCMLDLRV